MRKFLWDLDIEQLPLGWEEQYQEALKEFPNGTVIKGYFLHPVEYRAQILSYFHTYQAKAKSEYEQLLKEFDVELLNSLVGYDKLLYSVLYEWLDDQRDISLFDPASLSRYLEDSAGYILSADADIPFMEPYKKLQFIQMDINGSV